MLKPDKHTNLKLSVFNIAAIIIRKIKKEEILKYDELLTSVIKETNENSKELLNETYITQPVLFIIEYSLTRLFMEWGITPAGMIGHSIGEYVAACISGVLSLNDALLLVSERGKIMQTRVGKYYSNTPLIFI